MLHADICIAGAGIIGLSLALELERRGASALVAEATTPLRQASTAAAGMLAAEDPENPLQLLPLSRLSRDLYPNFLARIEELSGLAVPFQTNLTLQRYDEPHASLQPPTHPLDEATRIRAQQKLLHLLAPDALSDNRFHLLTENSVDPRQLAPALLRAVQQSPRIQLLENAPVQSTESLPAGVRIETPNATIEAHSFVDCTGAWSTKRTQSGTATPSIIPIKGQMLALAIPQGLDLDLTIRTPPLYIVPRLHGPAAGRVIVGATVEDVGFDTTVHHADITTLHRQASALIPALAHAEVLESWAGLRPSSSDRLPFLGAHPTHPHHFLATGHYRNGILLAPGTAHVLAALLLGERPAVDLSAFSCHRIVTRVSLAAASLTRQS